MVHAVKLEPVSPANRANYRDISSFSSLDERIFTELPHVRAFSRRAPAKLNRVESRDNRLDFFEAGKKQVIHVRIRRTGSKRPFLAHFCCDP